MWQSSDRNPYAEPKQPRFLDTLAGPIELVTAPTGQVVTTAEAKAQCRIETSVTDDDTYVDGLVADATEYVEKATEGHRQLLAATFDLPVRAWWCGRPLRLPRPPLTSVTSIKYYDWAGVQQTLASTYYEVRTPWRAPGAIYRAANQVWPDYQCDREFPITVRFVAGYGTIPRTFRRAILLVVGHWYANREAVLTGTVSKEIELAVTALLNLESWGSYS